MTKLKPWPLLLGALCVACDGSDSFAPDPTPAVESSAYPAMSQQGEGAWVFNRGGGQPGPSASECYFWSQGVRLTTHDMTVVHTPSGRVIAKCFFSGLPPTASGRADTIRGWTCSWWIGGILHSSTSTQWTRSPGGTAAMTCRLDTDVPPPQ